MDSKLQEVVETWLPRVAAGELSWTELAEHVLRREHPASNLHQPDTDRARRCGFSEVIYGEGKTPESIVSIAGKLLASGTKEVLVTRVVREAVASIASHFAGVRYDLLGRTLRLRNIPWEEASESEVVASENSTPESTDKNTDKSTDKDSVARVMVVCAGSTDLPVAREALETLRWMGAEAELLSDVGVAGPYRLLPHLDRLRSAAAVVVIAGMEGALASVVGGLVDCPIIAVPTSVGYGANLHGITTMLSMLSSCAAGVTVVNVDAGFKGGYAAGLIARKVRGAAYGQ